MESSSWTSKPVAVRLRSSAVLVPSALNLEAKPPELHGVPAGSFPEVRQAQFPLGMGKGDSKSAGTLAITLGSDGQVNYDAVLRQSKLADRHVASSHGALVPKIDDINNGVRCLPGLPPRETTVSQNANSSRLHSCARLPCLQKAMQRSSSSSMRPAFCLSSPLNRLSAVARLESADSWVPPPPARGAHPPAARCPQSLAKPDEEEVEKTMKETQAALDRVVGVRIQAAQPTSLAPQPGAPTYIKYTPAQQGAQYASGAGQRIIKMQDMPVDPLEPPKFRAKKARLPAPPPALARPGLSHARVCLCETAAWPAAVSAGWPAAALPQLCAPEGMQAFAACFPTECRRRQIDSPGSRTRELLESDACAGPASPLLLTAPPAGPLVPLPSPAPMPTDD